MGFMKVSSFLGSKVRGQSMEISGLKPISALLQFDYRSWAA